VGTVTASKGRGRGAPRAAQWRKKFTAPWGSPSAACLETGHRMFYEDQATRAELKAAVTLCHGCIVRPGCLESAMAEEKSGGSRYGIRGGLLPKERKALQTLRTVRANRARKAQEEQEEQAARAPEAAA
jgi:Transcription factor WhiB